MPDRGGQPTQIVVHMGLGRLRGLDGADAAEAGWGAAAAPGAECDASIVPVVTGHLDPGVLDRLAAALLRDIPARPGSGAAAAAAAGYGRCGQARAARG